MTTLAPLAVAVPLVAAALLALLGHHLPNRADTVAALLAVAVPLVLTAALLARVSHGLATHWFGGWTPARGRGFPVGVAFAVDRIGAGLALLVLVLLLAALAYSWRYVEGAHSLYLTLLLVFGGAMVGFALSGDLFNMFVFFELMSVAAFALTAHRVEEASPLEGAFNFAVTNTIGAFLVLLGIALLYGRTGSLNLAEIGVRLARDGRHDGLVVTAFALVTCGFLVKAAAVPFHFWLADAHATAPAPVCVLFSGVMVELGLYAVARVYWTVFAGVVGGFAHGVTSVLLAAGAVTALVGALMCALQRHLKRLLAYSTISHAGCFLIGIALLTPQGLAGAALFVLAHAFAKAALFLAGGILLLTKGEIDELLLRGRGRDLPLVGAAWLIAALALASPPFLGTFTGHALTDDAATAAGRGWVPVVVALATIVSTGAIVRAGARVFLGLGESRDPLLSEEPRESPPPRDRPGVGLMEVVTLLAALAGLATGAWTALAANVEEAAHAFVDRAGYAQAVLHARPFPAVEPQHWHTTSQSVAWAVVTLTGSFAVGGLTLYRARLPSGASAVLAAAVRPLRVVHSGHIGDYVAWLTFGTAVLGGLFALAIR